MVETIMNDSQKVNKKRRMINFSIKKRMQLRLLFRIMIIILVAVMLCGLIFIIGSQKKAASTYNQFHIQLRNFRELVLPLSIITTVVGLFAALILALFFPLYLAGPLYRIERTIEHVTHGDLSDNSFNIRSKDELHELAQKLSRMVTRMRERISLLKADHERMRVIYSQMTDALEKKDLGTLIEIMPGLEKEITNMKEMLDEFKVS
jgi:signal transduction histidine kinase